MVIFLDSVSEKFTPSHVTPHDGQTVKVIYPGTNRPRGGYRVLINTSLSNWNTATEFDQYNQTMNVSQSRIAYRWLINGGAVLTAPLTVSRGGATGNNITDASYDPDAGAYGAAYTGNGVFIPPGQNPGSRTIEPWLDPDWHMSVKDVWYLRHYVARRATALGLDNGRVSYMGSSAGAVMGAYAIYGADQRVNLGLDDVPASDMKWGACIAMNMPSRLLTMGQSTAVGHAFPDKTDTPDFDTPAAKLENADEDYQDALSFLTFDTGVRVPLYLGNNTKTYSVSLTPPYSDGGIATDFHSVDFGAMIKLARRTQRFVAWDDEIALNGHEEAAYDDNASDDDSLFLVDVVDKLDTFLDKDDTVMANASVVDTIPQYSHTEHLASGSLSDSAFVKIIDAGPHKMIHVQNVDAAATAVLRISTAGPTGAPAAQWGHFLAAPSSTVQSEMKIFTGGEAIYAKSENDANQPNFQITIYF